MTCRVFYSFHENSEMRFSTSCYGHTPRGHHADPGPFGEDDFILDESERPQSRKHYNDWDKRSSYLIIACMLSFAVRRLPCS